MAMHIRCLPVFMHLSAVIGCISFCEWGHSNTIQLGQDWCILQSVKGAMPFMVQLYSLRLTECGAELSSYRPCMLL